jgi:hypothetical protein
MHVEGILYDLAKPLDCVHHENLLSKLYLYDTEEIAAEMFYLKDGKQRVKIKPESFLKLGNNKAWSSPRIKSMALSFHNIHKQSSSNKKYLIRISNIC